MAYILTKREVAQGKRVGKSCRKAGVSVVEEPYILMRREVVFRDRLWLTGNKAACKDDECEDDSYDGLTGEQAGGKHDGAFAS